MAMKATEALVAQHVSIVKNWHDCPVVKCTKCCRWVRASEGQYHCPLCPVSDYPPSTKDRLHRHLQEHQRDGITCRGWQFLQCRMKCGGLRKPHFHCLYCTLVIVGRDAAQTHISNCVSMKQGSKQENMPVISATKISSLDSMKVTHSELKSSSHPTIKCKTPVESGASEESQGNCDPMKRSQSIHTTSAGDIPVKRRRGRPPSTTKVAGRRVGRPRAKQKGVGEDALLDLRLQLTDLHERAKKENVNVNDGEVEGRQEEEEVFPVLAAVVPQAVLAMLPGNGVLSLRKVAQQSGVKWVKVGSGYMMQGNWADMMTTRTHVQQMLKDARSNQAKISSTCARRITKSSHQWEDDTEQGDSETVTGKGDSDTTPPIDVGLKEADVKEECGVEGEIADQDNNKSDDYEDTTEFESAAEVKKEPKSHGLETRTRRGLHNRVIFKNPEQANHTCDECGYKSTLEGIKKHRARRHSSVEHACAVCGMKFGIRYDMRRHRMTHFDIHGNMLPDAVTLLKSFQPNMSPMALSHLETLFVPEGSSSDVSKPKNETKTIQELLDFRNEVTTQPEDNDVPENGRQEQDVPSAKTGSPGDLPLGCPWCSITSFSFNDLHQHCKDKHLKWSFLCPVCDQQCPSKEDLSDHCSETHTGIEVQLNDDTSIPAVCQMCQFKGNVSDMSSHMTVSHTPTFQCRLCDQSIIAKDALCCHKDEHLAAGTLVGMVHEKSRRGRKPVKKPQRLPKEYIKFTCEFCGRKLVGRASYSVHMKTHRLKPLLKCDQCDFSCYKPGLYNQHYRRKHCDEQHPCSLCDTVCASEANLKFHMQSVHRQGPSSVCEQCGKVFSTRRFLHVHVRRVHRAEKRYFCKVCGKGFFERVRMNEHQEVHKEGAAREQLKNFTCSFCGKRFLRQAHMLQHENIHTGTKPFQCKICGKAFCYNAEVRKHMAVHSDLRPHRCTYCGKGFKFRYKLTYHMTLHTKDSKHRCNDCGKVFTVKTTLKKHRCKGPPDPNAWATAQSLTQHVLHIIVPEEQETDDVKSQLASMMPQQWTNQMEMKPEGVVERVIEGGVDSMVEVVPESMSQNEAVSEAGVVYMCGVCSMMFSDQDLVNAHMLEHGTTTDVLEQIDAVTQSSSDVMSESQTCDVSQLHPDVMSEAPTAVIMQESAETSGDVISQMYVIAQSNSEVMSDQTLSTAGVIASDGDIQVEVVTLSSVDDTDLETAATALTHLAQ